jgi:hypothetical protein
LENAEEIVAKIKLAHFDTRGRTLVDRGLATARWVHLCNKCNREFDSRKLLRKHRQVEHAY